MEQQDIREVTWCIILCITKYYQGQRGGKSKERRNGNKYTIVYVRKSMIKGQNLTYYQLNFPSGKELVSNSIEREPKYTACLNLYSACQKTNSLYISNVQYSITYKIYNKLRCVYIKCSWLKWKLDIDGRDMLSDQVCEKAWKTLSIAFSFWRYFKSVQT